MLSGGMCTIDYVWQFVNITSDRLHQLYREINPEAVVRRRPKFQTNADRPPYNPHGPDWVWHIDGHDKMNHWGIQIYFAVDAYSRFIIWWYVGIENRTRLSVAKQYLETLRKVNTLAKTIQSDRGGEVPIAANVHYEFRKRSCTPDELEALEFDDCWIYGTSKMNSRVEKLWNHLSQSSTRRWVVSPSIVFSKGLLYANNSA
jgi:hypothetical protein